MTKFIYIYENSLSRTKVEEEREIENRDFGMFRFELHPDGRRIIEALIPVENYGKFKEWIERVLTPASPDYVNVTDTSELLTFAYDVLNDENPSVRIEFDSERTIVQINVI